MQTLFKRRKIIERKFRDNAPTLPTFQILISETEKVEAKQKQKIKYLKSGRDDYQSVDELRVLPLLSSDNNIRFGNVNSWRRRWRRRRNREHWSPWRRTKKRKKKNGDGHLRRTEEDMGSVVRRAIMDLWSELKMETFLFSLHILSLWIIYLHSNPVHDLCCNLSTYAGKKIIFCGYLCKFLKSNGFLFPYYS